MTIQAIAAKTKEASDIHAIGGSWMERVVGAIKTASNETGVNFTYLMNKAAQESGFKTDAKASTSSATGLYQFTEQTWLRTVAEYGDKHGMGPLAGQIDIRADGKAVVKDRATRTQILELRKNPEMAASMAAELAQENRASLETQVGGKIGNTELYLAHFLGASGAADFIQAARSNPEAKAAALLPGAAEANRSVFYTAEGKPRSVGQIYDRFAAKMEGKGVDAPQDLAAPRTAVASLTEALDKIPDLRLSISESLPTKIASLAKDGTSKLGGAVSAESLFSVMILSQMDNLTPASIKADRNDKSDKYSSNLMG